MKSIVITGAASGIGKAVADKFYQDGWYVGLFDVAEAPLLSMQEQWGSERCHIQVVNVTDSDALAVSFEKFVLEAGKLDVLFNCAGLLEFGHFEEISLQRHHQIIDVNNRGLLNCCYLAFPFLAKTPGARVINMSSQSSMYGVPGLSSYAATKSWVKSFTEAINIEWQRHDIHVTDVAPPFVNTPMVSGGSHIKEKAGVNFSPEDVANQVKKALNSRRTHWRIGLEHKLQNLVQGLTINPVLRLVMKHLSGY